MEMECMKILKFFNDSSLYEHSQELRSFELSFKLLESRVFTVKWGAWFISVHFARNAKNV